MRAEEKTVGKEKWMGKSTASGESKSKKLRKICGNLKDLPFGGPKIRSYVIHPVPCTTLPETREKQDND